MLSIRSSTLLSLLLLSASAAAGGGDRVDTNKITADAITAAFAPATHTSCPSALEPCAAPTSSTVIDFAKLVRDVLDGRGPQALRFAETGTLFELVGEFDPVRETSPDGGERLAQRARSSQARYRLHQAEIDIRSGHVRFDRRDYPYHGTHALMQGVESRYYCIDYPHHCVILEFPLAPAESGDLPLDATPPGTVGVKWFDIKPAPGGLQTQVVDEKRWSGVLGALTDQRDAARIDRARIDYIGMLTLIGGDGSPIRSAERDWPRFGSAGCMVAFTLDPSSGSILFTDTQACSANSLGSRLDIGSAQFGGATASERPGVAASRVVSPMRPPTLGYTATVRANDISLAPLTSVSDRWQAVGGAIFGTRADTVAMAFAGANSVLKVTGLRKDLVLDGADLGLSLEALMAEREDETEEP